MDGHVSFEAYKQNSIPNRPGQLPSHSRTDDHRLLGTVPFITNVATRPSSPDGQLPGFSSRASPTNLDYNKISGTRLFLQGAASE